MKTKTILFATITLLLIMFGAGCEVDNQIYQGKIVSLNDKNGCDDIIEISESVPQGLPVTSRITFGRSLFKGELKIGETANFKVIKYEKYPDGPGFGLCLPAEYIGQLEFYNK